jgi:hypothetical protein
MTRRWSRLLALAASVASATAEAAPRVAAEGPFDFGIVERGARIEHVFRVTNAGDAPLRLEQVKSTCGCTVALISDPDVAPGREGRVAVTLDTARMAGRVTKIVTVYTNDPATPTAALALTGAVHADLVTTPAALYLGRVRRGEGVSRDIVVAPGRPGAVYAVTAVESSNPALAAEIQPVTAPDPRTAGPGGVAAPAQRIVVRLAKELPLGRFSAQLVLRTNSPREPAITVPVFGSVEGDVVVLPPQLTFGVARRGAAAERELHIRNHGAAPLTVTRVVVRPEAVAYTLETVRDGVEWELTLRLPDGLPPGKVEGSVEIFTDHPKEGRLVIPLYAIVRGGSRRS